MLKQVVSVLLFLHERTGFVFADVCQLPGILAYLPPRDTTWQAILLPIDCGNAALNILQEVAVLYEYNYYK